MVSTRGFPTDRGRPLRVLVDGRCRDLIEVVDQGLQYGDGLFETLRMRDGAPCQWQRRLDRLAFGAGRLGMPSPDLERLHTEIADAARGLDDGVLKLILTRGSGGRGYRPPDSPQPPTHPAHLCVAYTAPFGSWEEGVMVRYCRTPATINPALAGIKHLNLICLPWPLLDAVRQAAQTSG
jgi:4-amino-4-deoxychorismate lyase